MRASSKHDRGFPRLWGLALGVLLCISAWAAITAGEPTGENPDLDAYRIELSDVDYEHWSFLPITLPAPPEIDDAWIRNPIDAFVLQKLRDEGLTPSPPADDRTWVRRVYFDLIGLPPAPEEVRAFLDDAAADKRERLVDRLLADPGYGIRWGRRWLDVVRYAETNGYERDGDKPSAWRYRDYVIDSLNADKPFDRFLTEQLAGDEVRDVSAETLIATTFLRLGTWDDEPADPKVDRYDQLDDVLGTVSSTFLGMTLRCARCHNHKFEPISQIDYARMLAIFEPLKRPQKKRADLDVLVGTPEELAAFAAAEDRHQDALETLQDQISDLDEHVRARFFAVGKTEIAADALQAHQTTSKKRTSQQKRLVGKTQRQLDKEIRASRTPDEQRQRDAFRSAIQAIEAAAPVSPPRGYIWRETIDAIPVTHVFRRGDPTTPAGEVQPGFPAVLRDVNVEIPTPDKSRSTTGRRLALAKWMTSPQNPLVARVAVNRIWQGHFGEGLVRSENDFGIMGLPPSHPELLDWLAHTFRENGWSLKSLHRLIVLSNTYAQSSTVRTEAADADPENEWFWRFPLRRLEAEPLRDSILAVSGKLNHKMGGPSVYPKIAEEVLAGQSRPGLGWGKSDEAEASRRAIYIFMKRSMLVPLLELFDLADTTASCEQRSRSTIPTQALTLLNGEFLNRQAAYFAERLTGEDRAARVQQAYQWALSRDADETELATALDFLDRQQQLIFNETPGMTVAEADKQVWQAFCLAIYNLNEFVYID
ncbi:hypothetical protein Mal52_08070 [Symmachiella dynata]|uniref:Planctomycete cytochrome C n=1 Tax=Symmachiella dynata TaxID=2527995 RepID=A0A517ZIQ6_9PLAN|nr:hypothetical protein Mal52_08070 [Symmachiella dynata]